MSAIWEGWLQFGLAEPMRQVLSVADLVLLIIVFYLIFRFFNTKKGFGYLGFVAVAVLLLVVTAYITLPGLHLVVQSLLLVLIIGLPLFFEEEWSALFRSQTGLTPTVEAPFLKTFSLILISVLAALTVLFLANGVTTRTAELPQDIALAAVNNKEGTAANFGSVQAVRAIITAPREIWPQLTADSFSATVDLAGRGEGTFELEVKISSKNPSVVIRRIKPSKLTVTIEPVIKKTLTLSARYSGKAENNLVPDQSQFDPSSVEITGPRSIVADLTQAFVLINLNKQSGDIELISKVVALNVRGEVISGVTFEPPETKVRVPLVAVGRVKTVGVIASISGQPANGYWIRNINISPPTVAITGAVEVLEGLNAVETEPISVAGLSQDKTQTVALKLPGGVELAGQTGRFTVTLEIDRIQTTKTVNPEVVYDGLSSSLKVTAVSPNIISVIVSGASQILETLNSSSVKLTLRLAPYKTAGTFSVSIANSDIVLPNGVGLVSFLPSAVDVTLENK